MSSPSLASTVFSKFPLESLKCTLIPVPGAGLWIPLCWRAAEQWNGRARVGERQLLGYDVLSQDLKRDGKEGGIRNGRGIMVG